MSFGTVHHPGSGLSSQASCLGFCMAGAAGVVGGMVGVVALERICSPSGKIERLNFPLRAQRRAWANGDPIHPCDLLTQNFPTWGPLGRCMASAFSMHYISLFLTGIPGSLSHLSMNCVGFSFFLPSQQLVARRICWLLCVRTSLGLAGCHRVWNFIKDKPACRQRAAGHLPRDSAVAVCPALDWLLPCRLPTVTRWYNTVNERGCVCGGNVFFIPYPCAPDVTGDDAGTLQLSLSHIRNSLSFGFCLLFACVCCG